MHMMVNFVKEFISTELMAHLYRESSDRLMEENPAGMCWRVCFVHWSKFIDHLLFSLPF
eukprot:m.18868 g.18868  ORF g.18868 m.18868 type:complete len:59 (-) comp8370_c1_seq1:2027-2203(-)